MEKTNKHLKIVKLFIPIAILGIIALTIFYSFLNKNGENGGQFFSISGLSEQEISFLTDQGFLPTIQGGKEELTIADLKSPGLVEQELDSPDERFEVLATKLDSDNYQLAFKLENKADQSKEFYLIPISKESQLQFKEIKGVVNNKNTLSISKEDARKEPLEQIYDTEKHKKELKPELAKAYQEIKENGYSAKPMRVVLSPKSTLLAKSLWQINRGQASAGLEPVYFLIYGSAGGVKDDLVILDEYSLKPQAADHRFPSLKEGATEIVSKRTENQKVFDNRDGTQQYIISSGPFHYKDGNEWKDIDTNITPATGDADFKMEKSIYQVKFKKKFDSNKLVDVEKDGEGFTTTFGNLIWTNKAEEEQIISAPQSTEGQSNENKLVFPNAYGQGLDLSYETSDIKLGKKLNIPSIESLPAPNQNITKGEEPALALNTELELDNDMEMFIDGVAWDGQKISAKAKEIEFKSNGVTAWRIVPSKAWDSQGEEKAIYGDLIIEAKGRKISISVSFPYSWLKTAQYPVTIDPDTYYGATTDGYFYGDNSTYATARSTSYPIGWSATGASVPVGQRYYYNPMQEAFYYTVFRNYLEFDTSGIDDAATVTQANLYLTAHADGSTTNFTVRVHEYIWTSPLGDATREADYDGALAATANAVDWKNTADAGFAINTPYASANLRTAYIQKGATKTQFALVSSRDVAATTPTGDEYIYIHMQEDTTQEYRPYLSITAEAPPTEATRIKGGLRVKGGLRIKF